MTHGGHIPTGRLPGRPRKDQSACIETVHFHFGRRCTLYPHAILNSDKTVIAIRGYPNEHYSPSVIPIQGRPCKPGWTWNGRAFNPARTPTCPDISPSQSKA